MSIKTTIAAAAAFHSYSLALRLLAHTSTLKQTDHILMEHTHLVM
tara:strand:+ start:342 stop:476 length:135 start_codon:yes stop_codon:yes gene_type:complete